MIISEDSAWSSLHSRWDDECIESIASLRIGERLSLLGIGKISAVKKNLQVALKKFQSGTFIFSRTWIAILTVLYLFSGRIALQNITILLSDDDLAFEDLLIGLLDLQCLKFDTCKIIEYSRHRLQKIDFKLTDNWKEEELGYIARLMLCEINRIIGPVVGRLQIIWKIFQKEQIHFQILFS